MTNKRILFYSSVATKKQFSYQEYYRTDIRLLRELGYRVMLSNHFYDYLCIWKYDVVFIYFYRFGLLPAKIARLAGKKVYFTGGIDFLDKNFVPHRTYLIQKYLFILCYLFSTRCIIGSGTDERNIRGAFPKLKFSRLVLSHHVIDFDKYSDPDISSREKIFTTIAWLKLEINAVRKGVDKCLLLFAELLKLEKFKDHRLIIIGPPGAGTELIGKLIAERGIQDKVTLTGMVTEEEKIRWLKKSRYYLQLSETEGFGISAIEAIAAGNLVIHSGRGGLAEAIGDHGLVPGTLTDYPRMAAEIDRYLDEMSEEKYRRIVDNGIDHVKRNFSYGRRKADFKKIIG